MGPQAGEPLGQPVDLSYSTPARVSGMAVASMVLGILAIPLGCVGVGIVLGLVALILGIVALMAINREPERLGGKGYALTGIITGAAGMVIGPMLVAVLMPSLGGSGMTTRTLCGTNLKGQGMAIALYAASYSDKLPSFKGGPNLNDLGADNLNALLGVIGPGASGKIFNCPQNGSTPAAAGTVMNYVYFTDRPGLDPTVRTFLTPARASNRTSGVMPPVILHGTFVGEKDPARAELAMDVIISATDPPGAKDFASVAGQSTNHMNGSNQPAGENVLCCDSHVVWRSWSGAAETAVKQGGGYYLWVIDP